MKIKYFIVACLALGIITLNFSSCKKEKKTVKQTEVSFKKEGELTIHKITSDSTQIKLDIEIADTEYDTETGLMYRNTMESKEGMLFIFDDVTERYFYMKNTHIPLDIIYIGEDKKIVSFQKNAKPMSETTLPSNFPAKYVLEVNAGLVESWPISVGDSIAFYESSN